MAASPGWPAGYCESLGPRIPNVLAIPAEVMASTQAASHRRLSANRARRLRQYDVRCGVAQQSFADLGAVFRGERAALVMQPCVIGMAQNLKVLDTVVELVAVAMVDRFIGVELTTQVALHNQAMGKTLASLYPKDQVPLWRDTTRPVGPLHQHIWRPVTCPSRVVFLAPAASRVRFTASGYRADRVLEVHRTGKLPLQRPPVKRCGLFVGGGVGTAGTVEALAGLGCRVWP